MYMAVILLSIGIGVAVAYPVLGRARWSVGTAVQVQCPALAVCPAHGDDSCEQVAYMPFFTRPLLWAVYVARDPLQLDEH